MYPKYMTLCNRHRQTNKQTYGQIDRKIEREKETEERRCFPLRCSVLSFALCLVFGKVSKPFFICPQFLPSNSICWCTFHFIKIYYKPQSLLFVHEYSISCLYSENFPQRTRFLIVRSYPSLTLPSSLGFTQTESMSPVFALTLQYFLQHHEFKLEVMSTM